MTVPRYEVIPTDSLRPHEETDPDRIEEVVEWIEGDGYVREPVVADGEHRVILDGHHRFEALRRLGCVRVPVYLVDYESDDVRVTLWDGTSVDAVTKKEVVRRGVDGDRFPPKTTRHRFSVDLPEKRVALDALR